MPGGTTRARRRSVPQQRPFLGTGSDQLRDGTLSRAPLAAKNGALERAFPRRGEGSAKGRAVGSTGVGDLPSECAAVYWDGPKRVKGKRSARWRSARRTARRSERAPGSCNKLRGSTSPRHRATVHRAATARARSARASGTGPGPDPPTRPAASIESSLSRRPARHRATTAGTGPGRYLQCSMGPMEHCYDDDGERGLSL
jgi:hypothetical protein